MAYLINYFYKSKTMGDREFFGDFISQKKKMNLNWREKKGFQNWILYRQLYKVGLNEFVLHAIKFNNWRIFEQRHYLTQKDMCQKIIVMK